MVILFAAAVLAILALFVVSLETATLGVLFLTPVVPKFWAIGIGQGGFALTVQRAVLVEYWGLLAIACLLRPSLRRDAVRTTRAHWAALGALFVWTAWYVLASFRGLAGAGTGVVATITVLLHGPMMMALGFVLFREEKHRDRAVIVLCVSICILAAVAAVESLRGAPLFEPANDLDYLTREQGLTQGRERDGRYRAMATFSNPLELAAFMATAAPIAAWAVQHARGLATRILGVLACIGCLSGAILAQSRAGIMVVVLGLAGTVYVSLARSPKNAIGWVMLVLLTGTGAVGAALGLGRAVSALLDVGGAQGYQSLMFRLEQLRAGVALFQERVLFGVGPSRNVLDLVPMTGIDIFYLRVALEGGVVALAAFAAFAVLAAIPKRASAASPPELSRALMASFLASLVMMFAVSMYYAFFVGFVAVGAAWAMQLDQTPPGETSSANEP